MTDFLTSRSRVLEFQRCPRSRWLLHEAGGTGYELRRLGVPLATGGAAHLAFAKLLRSQQAEAGTRPPWGPPALCLPARVDSILGEVLEGYDAECAARGLDLKDLASESKVYAEQRALIEGLGRLAALRTIPRLLETYETLEVEKLDTIPLVEDSGELGLRILWRSIPDALLRGRDDGELYILSWKTPANLPRETSAWTDMQGLSEIWALEQRLKQEIAEALERGNPSPWASWQVRGVQMAYLLKGKKVDLADEEGSEASGKGWRHFSPLVWGFKDSSFPPKYAWSRYWRCVKPHPMRKSKWYPSGECPGDGRNHKRGDEWKLFPAWEAMGVAEWIAMLASGEITPEAGDPLELGFALPVPAFRPEAQVERWHRQIVAQERRIAENIMALRPLEQAALGDPEDLERLEAALDSAFPQHTEFFCENTYGRPCPAAEICWGPESTRENPLASGLFQIRTPYEPKEEEKEEKDA